MVMVTLISEKVNFQLISVSAISDRVWLIYVLPLEEQHLASAVIGNHFGLFLITYSSSIISASFGMAKCLKVGVARTIGQEGMLDGYLTKKFLIGRQQWKN